MPEKILIVDDDIDSLKLIGLMLQKRGYQILAANTGAQALSKAAAESPDLIILDVMMPDLDGYEVCRRLRADPATEETPIIMFSAKSLVEDKVLGFEAGADDYLSKPTHPAELVSRVKALLAGRTARPGGMHKAVIVAMIAAKGGVGTSTVALNVAASLAQRVDTILADFRPGMGSTGLELGFSRSTGLANLANKHPDSLDTQAVEAELAVHSSGLRLLLSSAQAVEAQLHIDPNLAEAIVEQLALLANAVVMDLGCGLDTLNRQLVMFADQTVVVVEPQRTALLMTRELVRALGELKLGPEQLGVVLVNRTHSDLQISWQEAERLLDHELMAVISPAPEMAFQAAEAGMPMILHQPNSVAANQFSRLADEVVARIEAVRTTQADKSPV
ncbi:MAG: response regulator [Anaerolineae bacterium]|nr:response regulator [Anaerolineae bacterium]